MAEPTAKETITIRKMDDGFIYRDRDGNEIINLPPKGSEPRIITALEKGKLPCPLSQEKWDEIAEKLNVPANIVFDLQDGKLNVGQFSAPAKILADHCPKDKTASR